MTTLFLFAHQDDEIGALHEVAEIKRLGGTAVCVFLTNGAWAGVTSAERNAESTKTLAALGVSPSETHFLGTDIGVPDGGLIEHLELCFDAVSELITDLQARGTPVTRIVMHAWEGGHQDHDAGHLLGVALAHQFDVLAESRQFPLYRMPASRWTMTFARPLPANGVVETTRIPLLSRLRYLSLLANYRSQLRVIAKLLPLLIREYATSGVQKLQPVSLSRVRQAPAPPPMLYEIWKLYSYDRFKGRAKVFVEKHLPGNPVAPEAAE
ncbi:MAG: PIG-L family deacetylase [Hyphomicrobium sp.]|nr:PIG-L family deacetylase [Hyphomicrobium sp.]